MGNAITALPAALLSLLGKRNKRFYQAAFAVYIKGLLNGYSMANLDWMVAQMALESDWGASNVARTLNNSWGMKMPRTRPTLAIGESCGHDDGLDSNVCYAKFKSTWSGTLDRFMWDDNRSESVFPHRRNEFYPDAVAAYYNGANTYAGAISNIADIHRQEFNLVKFTLAAFVPLSVLGLIYLVNNI